MRDFLEIRLLRGSIRGSDAYARGAIERTESNIVDELRRLTPHYGVRTGLRDDEPGADPTRIWVIEPVDGVSNYAQGLSHWAMTMALVHKSVPVLAVLFNPLENELITAETGMGSWSNNTRIRTSQKKRLSEFSVAAAPLADHGDGEQVSLDRLQRVASIVKNVRLFGSPSLDLAHVSCGRLDGYWNETMTPSNLPASALILAEAGGLIEPLLDNSEGLMAASSTGYPLMAELLHSHIKA